MQPLKPMIQPLRGLARKRTQGRGGPARFVLGVNRADSECRSQIRTQSKVITFPSAASAKASNHASVQILGAASRWRVNMPASGRDQAETPG